jgi:hypothetical protein
MVPRQASNGYATRYATLLDSWAAIFLISAKSATAFSQGCESNDQAASWFPNALTPSQLASDMVFPCLLVISLPSRIESQKFYSPAVHKNTLARFTAKAAMNLAKLLYRGGRPNRVASVINRWTAAVYALGIAPNYLVTLDVVGKRSGRVFSLPLVMVVVGNERYLVSMLGEEVDWVRNARAAGGNVTLRHGRREEVRLEEVAANQRAPLLKAYLKRAPGARPHLPIHKDAPLSEFEQVSSQFPVFRVVPRSTI